ncbi:MAG TPA: DinB family protein [Candidatus Sulfotelmatobacter sp.]|nr:DinB family protein [Candidatus Sulfotelmatobacter sp.]
MASDALTQLLRGKGAHIDPLACIEDLDAHLASQQISNFPHSIANLVFHMNYWMNYELKRIRGQKPQYPEHNAESFPTTPQNWDQLRRDFSWFLQEFAKLAESTPQELARQIESIHEGDKKVANTLEAIISQMIAHNSYHTGQIALIRRALNAWPPNSGGDTW